MYRPNPRVDDIAASVAEEYAQTPANCKVLLKEIQILRNHRKSQAAYIKRLENELHTKTTST